MGLAPIGERGTFRSVFIFCKFCLKLVELAFCLGLFGGTESFDFISIFFICLHGGKTCILMCGLGVVWIMRLGLG